MNVPDEQLDVVLGFDMETDIGSWTPFYEGLVNGTPRMLEVLDEAGAVSTCFFVGQAAKDHPEVVRMVRDAGHEIGCHSLFHETVGEPLLPIPGITPLLDHEVQPRIELATQWVEEVAGVRPVSFRCPRLFGSTAVCNALEALDYVADASYPMYHLPDRLAPYHPSADDWRSPGNLSLVEIPNFADHSNANGRGPDRRHDQWPVFRTESADALMTRVDGFLDYCENKGVARTVVCFYLHPWEFWTMPAGLIHYGEGAVKPDEMLVTGCGDYALQQFGRLLALLKQRGARFLTAEQCAREWA